MTRQVFIMLILVVAVVMTCNGMARAQAGGQAPGQVSKPQGKPAAPPAPHDHSHMTKTTKETSPAEKYFTDVELINQDGKKVRFYSDVLKGKTVVVNAFFTSCTSVCPPMNRNMEKIQEALGERVGRDVFLVSITVDPEVDTPARMKEYAQKFHAGKGWIFLTGKKENLDWALYKLGQYVERKDDHKTIFIIGNEPTGLWKKAFGMANVAELVQVVESVVNDKGDKGSTR
ncbi:MAG TPA: SCO family protein [Pyrinomonadaceae bacterium]|nr:SCO family protein [Pyrinomonadaceae bacterium]